MKNKIFHVGDTVYHRNLKKYGIVHSLESTNSDPTSIFVDFYGEDVSEVSVKLIQKYTKSEFDISNNMEDVIESLYWEFHDEKDKLYSERDVFKGKVRRAIREYIKEQTGNNGDHCLECIDCELEIEELTGRIKI